MTDAERVKPATPRTARLVAPTTAVHRSFLAAMAEVEGEGTRAERGRQRGHSFIARELLERGLSWDTTDGFAAFVAALLDQSREDAPRPAGYVPTTTLWYVAAEDETIETGSGEYLGRVSIRHRLTAALQKVGGHIGYDVRPGARRRGHGTAMLAAALPVARRLGIDVALVTCDRDNVASRKIIEVNGGRLVGESDAELHFRVPTAHHL